MLNPVYAGEDQSIQATEIDTQIEIYLSEFASANLRRPGSAIYLGLQSALKKLPEDIFIAVTDRKKPTLFIHYFTAGIARYAGSEEFTVLEDDAPTFTNGFYMIKISDALVESHNQQAIEGVILHEIAHRVLEHTKVQKPSCELEKEANHLVQDWGHEELFSKAKELFGAKKKGDSPCSSFE